MTHKYMQRKEWRNYMTRASSAGNVENGIRLVNLNLFGKIRSTPEENTTLKYSKEHLKHLNQIGIYITRGETHTFHRTQEGLYGIHTSEQEIIIKEECWFNAGNKYIKILDKRIQLIPEKITSINYSKHPSLSKKDLTCIKRGIKKGLAEIENPDKREAIEDIIDNALYF